MLYSFNPYHVWGGNHMKTLGLALAYILLAPFIGGLLAGLDRRITAKMQNRVGPPLLQPFYDVLKLLGKENLIVSRSQNFYVLCFLLFVIFTGALFFSGNDFLLVIFALTLANIFLVLAAYAANSPYSHIGAERELIQIMAYEPMVIMTCVGMYMVTGSFRVSTILTSPQSLILFLPGVFIGFTYILTIKFRKSPFDLSLSHHAHQELVKGITTEFSGRTLAAIELAHWYENVLFLGFVYLFFGSNPLIGLLILLAVYVLEIFIDNSFARLKWQWTVQSSWLVAATLGLINIAFLYLK